MEKFRFKTLSNNIDQDIAYDIIIKELINYLSQHKIYLEYSQKYKDYHIWNKYYINDKQKPISNVIKRILKENNINLDNNLYSKLINYINKVYYENIEQKIFEISLYDVNYFDSEEYNKYNFGDNNSCYRKNKSNSICQEFIKTYLKDYMYLVIFKVYDLDNNLISLGRSWSICLPNNQDIKYMVLFNFYHNGRYSILDNLDILLGIFENMLKEYFNENIEYIKDPYYLISIPYLYVNNDVGEIFKDKTLDMESINAMYDNIIIECKYCKNEYELRYFVLEDNKIMCNDCSYDIVRCDYCNRSYHIEELYYLDHLDIRICENCHKEHFGVCDICEYDYETSYLTYIRHYDIFVCEDCINEYFYECWRCGEYFKEEDIIEVDNYTICKDCIEKYYRKCNYCGEYFRKSNISYIRNLKKYICDNCLEDQKICSLYNPNKCDLFKELYLYSCENILYCYECINLPMIYENNLPIPYNQV